MAQNNQLEVMYLTPTRKDANEIEIDDKYIKTVDDVKRAFDNKKTMFIEFYADWCGHCQSLSVLWKNLIKDLEKENKTSNMAIIAIEQNHHDNSIIKNIINKASIKIDGFPTVGAIVFKGDKPSFIPYNGDRTVKEMHKFININIPNQKQSGGGVTRNRRNHYKKSNKNRNNKTKNKIQKRTVRKHRTKSYRTKTYRKK
jgi:thiol-disulfide isomerase/thioredoxin